MFETIAHNIWGHYLPPTQPRNMSSAYITSETISDSAECYAGLSVRFESSAACMKLVSSRPKNNLQLLFVKMVRVTVVIYVEFRSF